MHTPKRGYATPRFGGMATGAVGGPVRLRRSILRRLQQGHHSREHDAAARLVLETIRVSDDLDVRPAAFSGPQNDLRRLRHDLGHGLRLLLDLVDRRLQQKGVMDRRADHEASLNSHGQAKAHHFRAVALHRPVEDRAAIDVGLASRRIMDAPAEDRFQRQTQQSPVHILLRPTPEHAVGVAVQAQEFAGAVDVNAGLSRDAFRPHSIIDPEHYCLAGVPYVGMGLLCRVGRRQPRLLGEGDVGVPAGVCLPQGIIARQRPCDGDLLR